MRNNRSPWLHQLDASRKHAALDKDIETDVAIIGAGIAGIATAFFTLKHTGKSVALLERYRLAHGATGHNAGQVVSYFEAGLKRLADRFGLPLAAEGQRDVEGAWGLIDVMYTEAGLDIPFSRFLGHEGLVSLTQLCAHLENARLRREAGLQLHHIGVARTAPFFREIPETYAGLWNPLEHAQVLELLETENPKYFSVVSEQKGVVNSALFCERVLAYLLRTYPERFALYEHAPVHKIVLREDSALIDAESHTVTAARVVLCTNGFENLHIINENGLGVDACYHANVRGSIGYMSGYLEEPVRPPAAFSYYNEGDETPDANYIYVTRRPYEYEKGAQHNLISIGGPEFKLDEGSPYSHNHEYPESALEQIDRFVREVYEPGPGNLGRYLFTWHGLMGYTTNGVRMVGPEPQNPVLLYNLGCNGVGILPSIMGGKKISRHIDGEQVPPSIFDVPPASAAG